MTDKAALRKALWEKCIRSVSECKQCKLASTRTNTVFGDGDPTSSLMFIGEAPGAEEDSSGLPFVGKAGQLLTQILNAAGIDRKDVFITNTLKCRPPGNRNPASDEMSSCDCHLQAQLSIIAPKLIVVLGAIAAKWLLKTSESITSIRGRWFSWHGISVMPMFHPSYLLRYPNSKEKGSPKHLSWLDIQDVKKKWDEVREIGR